MRRRVSSRSALPPASDRAGADRVVLWKRFVIELGVGTGQADDLLRQFQHANFIYIAEIDRPGGSSGKVHELNNALDKVVDVAERARLGTVSIDRDGFVPQGLEYEV